jgi:iron(III) transport system substrate-binding protein
MSYSVLIYSYFLYCGRLIVQHVGQCSIHEVSLLKLMFSLLFLIFIGFFESTVVWSQETTSITNHIQITKQAEQEGRLVIYSVLSNKAAEPLVNKFKELYPKIKVDYDGEGGATETYERFLLETKSKSPSADVMWSSAMDLQMNLVVGGFAAQYISPESAFIPKWANFKDLAWGTTYEPVVMVYNKQLLSPNDVPKNHEMLRQLLLSNKERFKGKVTLFDLEKSGVGYMFAVQDQRNSREWSDLLSVIGASKPFLASGSGEMLKRINAGESIVGYNIMGSYALSRSKKDLPNLGVSPPNDFTPILSRVMFINAHALHPNAAKLWVDFVLSQRGQEIIANDLELNSIRLDSVSVNSEQSLNKKLGSAAKLIPINEALVETLKDDFRVPFISRWKQAMNFLKD